MIKNIIFDIDGTLIDNEEVILQGFVNALKKYGYDYKLDELRFSYGIPGMVSIKKLGVKEEHQVLIFDQWVAELLLVSDDYELFEGIHEMLYELHKRGCNLGIVTSKKRQEFNGDFAKMDINKLFIASVCADEVDNPKPHKEPLIRVMQLMDVEHEHSIYIGDSVYDMQSAKSAGIRFGVATWGSRIDDYTDVDYILKKPKDILDIFGEKN